jgi:hypothetical protein
VPVPAHFYDVQTEVVELARVAAKRL